MASFANQVKAFEKLALDNVEKTFRGTVLDVFSAVVAATPVGNKSTWKNPQAAPKGYTGGRLRGNWQTSIGRAKSGAVDRKGGAGPKREVENAVSRLKSSDTITMANNLPYAHAVEYGHSSQAKRGMVRVTLRNFRRLVTANARKAKR
jgi:hypothetical protein